MSKLSIKQKNNLISGNTLAVEIPPTSEGLRCFITIGAYRLNVARAATGASKFLNGIDKNCLKFWLRKYEVKKDYIDSGDDISNNQLINSIHIKNIESIEAIESELNKYIDDFSKLDVEWKCENPI